MTHVAVPPPLFDALATDPRVDEHDLSSLRLVVTGGAHIGRRRRAGDQRAPGLPGAPGLRRDGGDVHRSAPRSAGRARRGPPAGSCPAPRRASSIPRPAPTPSPASRASSGSAARRSCRATTAGRGRPPPPHVRRLAAHRRPRRHPRRRPARDPRSPQGAHQGQGRLGGARRDRARAAPASGGARRRRGGRPRRRARRGADRVRRARRRGGARASSRTFAAARLARVQAPARDRRSIDEVPRLATRQDPAPRACASEPARSRGRPAPSPPRARRAARRSRRACPPGRPG